jgi:hypothetical protein
MGKRAALAPDLSRLALHETRAVGMEQEEQQAGSDAPVAGTWNGVGSVSLPDDVEKLIMQFYALASMRDDDGVPKILLMCQRLGDVCRVAKTTPWGSLDVVCGPNGTLYDRALLVLGLYRDCNNWAEFKQWTMDHIPNYESTARFYIDPRVYFERCCFEFKIRVLVYGNDLKVAQRGLINQHVINRPWTRAFHAYLIQRDPSLFKNLGRADAVLNAKRPYQKGDYTYYAKLALAGDGGMLKFIPGALRQPPDSTKVWPENGFTEAEFVALAKIAIDSKAFVSGEKDVEIFSRVPLDLRAQLFSAEQITQLEERFVNMEAAMDA